MDAKPRPVLRLVRIILSLKKQLNHRYNGWLVPQLQWLKDSSRPEMSRPDIAMRQGQQLLICLPSDAVKQWLVNFNVDSVTRGEKRKKRWKTEN